MRNFLSVRVRGSVYPPIFIRQPIGKDLLAATKIVSGKQEIRSSQKFLPNVYFTEEAELAVSFGFVFGRQQFRISTMLQVVLTLVLRGITQFAQSNSGTVPSSKPVMAILRSQPTRFSWASSKKSTSCIFCNSVSKYPKNRSI